MSLSSWIFAARPRTLSLSTAPVVVGEALAWATEGELPWPTVVAALIGSIFIQLGANLHNDAADFKRGGDGPDRVGPPRATASGLLDGAAVKRGAWACFAVAALMGAYLVWVGGWPIFLLGVASILSGWAYTGGPLPIAYTPLGELFVMVFFGLGAVCGTYWLCAAKIDPTAVEAGLALGLFAAAVLLVNNHRDVEADTRVGRRTLALIAAGRLVDQPIRPRTTRPRLQSNTRADRANPGLVQRLAVSWLGVVTLFRFPACDVANLGHI